VQADIGLPMKQLIVRISFIISLAVPGLAAQCQQRPSVIEIPVRINSFTVLTKSWDLVILNWVTETEVSNKTFEVQRSLDGVQFETIGAVPTIDGYAGPKSYSYRDESIDSIQTPRLLYRIRQVGSDGVWGYSKIVLADRRLGSNRLSVTVSPNPVGQQLNLRIKSPGNHQAAIRIINMDGRLILRQSGLAFKSENGCVPVNLQQGLTPGIYLVQLLFEDGSSTSIKFLKK